MRPDKTCNSGEVVTLVPSLLAVMLVSTYRDMNIGLHGNTVTYNLCQCCHFAGIVGTFAE